MNKFNWAIVGCGDIANDFAKAMNSYGGKIYSVANRTYANAVKFAEKYNIQKVYADIDDCFTDNNVDIVYIATPHNKHIDYILKALENGKHVLCEKAITLNSAQLESAVKLAHSKGLILAEAMTIYNMPIYEELLNHDLGKLQLAQVNFGSYKEYDMSNRFFNMNLAGGALLDIGVYALSCVRMFMHQYPNDVMTQVKFAPTGADEQSNIILKNSNGEMASVTLTLHAKQPKRATICFEKGYIEIFEYPRCDKAEIFYTDCNKEVIKKGDTQKALQYEIENMEYSVFSGTNIMKLDYTVDVMKIMTELREKWGMKYPEEM